MTDTALYEQPDSSEFSNLPLSGEGVFGPGLDELLKTREEKKKVDELIPDISKKRKFTSSQSESYMRPAYDRSYNAPAATSSTPTVPVHKGVGIIFVFSKSLERREARLGMTPNRIVLTKAIPSTLPTEEDWEKQLKNDQVSVIAKLPEIPVGGKLSHFLPAWEKSPPTNGF
ncbi:hypothetical protein ACF0H5_020624 [Mactra antiquata]